MQFFPYIMYRATALAQLKKILQLPFKYKKTDLYNVGPRLKKKDN